MTAKITISLPDRLLARVKAVVERGEADSVSAFVAYALDEALDPLTPEEFMAEWEEEFGPIPDEIKAETDRWMDEMGYPPDPRPGRGTR